MKLAMFMLVLLLVQDVRAGIRLRRHPMALRYNGQNQEHNQGLDDLALLRAAIGSELASLLAWQLEQQTLSLPSMPRLSALRRPYSPPAFFPLLKSSFKKANWDADNHNNQYYSHVGQDLGRSPTAL